MEKTWTKERLAAKLDGCEYRGGMPNEIVEAAKENNLVILHGAGNDRLELYGAITEEVGASSFFLLTKEGVPESDCGPDCPYFLHWLERAQKSGEAKKIAVFWCGNVWGGENWLEDVVPKDYDEMDGPVWCFETTMPHSAFSMYKTDGDDLEFFCRGIVLDLNEAFPYRNYTQLVMEQGGWETT